MKTTITLNVSLKDLTSEQVVALAKAGLITFEHDEKKVATKKTMSLATPATAKATKGKPTGKKKDTKESKYKYDIGRVDASDYKLSFVYKCFEEGVGFKGKGKVKALEMLVNEQNGLSIDKFYHEHKKEVKHPDAFDVYALLIKHGIKREAVKNQKWYDYVKGLNSVKPQ